MQVTQFQMNEYAVLAVPVLDDNFVYLVCRDGDAVLIDAGEAKSIFRTLEEKKLRLQKVLITHTDTDHVNGCREILDRLSVQSLSPSVAASEFVILGTPCHSISTPGHVAVHKVYYFPELAVLFSADALINGGCGRIKDGTAEQLFSSLQKICELPDETRIFGGHDYLVDNMEFARTIEPDNTDIIERLARYRTAPAAALFVTLAEEKKTNPFLRVKSVEEFAELRRQKDSF